MAITKLNSLAIPPDTVVESDISFPLDSASFTGDLTVDTDTLVVDSTDDRVGVGTNAPTNTLHIRKATGIASVFIDSATATQSNLYFSDTNTTSGAVRIGSAGDSLRFFTSTSQQAMHINSGGSVGINTTDPSALLEIAKTGAGAQLLLTQAGTDQLGLVAGSQGTGLIYEDENYFGIWSQDYADRGTENNMTSRFRLTSSGHVGIGEDAPYSVLHAAKNDSTALGSTLTSRLNDSRLFIQNTDTTTGNSAGITLNTAAGSNNYWFIDAVGASSYGAPLTFAHRTSQSGVTERLRINGNGRIGVNESNPLATLAVRGITSNLSSCEINCNSGGATIEVLNRNAGGAQTFGLYALGGAITFNTGSPYSEKVRIGTSGDLEINDGNLVVASGHGVSFAATSNGPSMSSEILDDYEEGSWTPTVSTSSSVSINQAQYTKIGRQVTASFYISWTNNQNNNSNVFQIGGYPFVSNLSNNYEAGSIGYVQNANVNDFMPIIHANKSYLYFHQNDGNGNTVKNSDIHTRGLSILIVTITYQLAN